MPFDPTEELVQAVRHRLEALLPPPWNTPILLAVSGGADSMALLHLLHRGGVPVAVAHFDHQTRAGASTREGAFVAETASVLGIPVHRGQGDVEAHANASTDSFEMAARQARYEFLVNTAKASGYSAIATGHHADDQAETLLLRVVRGTSPTGIAGIAHTHKLDGVSLVRPLLNYRRAALEAWLEAASLPWMEDASNLDTTVPRNRVRHDLLPDLCRDFNPRVVEALNRLAALQRMDESFLERHVTEAATRCTGDGDRIDRAVYCALDEALQHRLAARWIHEAGGDGSYDTIRRAVTLLREGRPGKQADLGNGVALFSGDSHAIIGPLSPAIVADVPLDVPGSVTVGGYRLSSRVLDRKPDQPLAEYCAPGRQVLDGAALKRPLTVRTRRSGDRFQPMGMDGSRKLKDYFNTLGLTRIERDRQLLVLSGDTIVWVVGHNLAGCAAVTDTTSEWVEIEATPETA